MIFSVDQRFLVLIIVRSPYIYLIKLAHSLSILFFIERNITNCGGAPLNKWGSNFYPLLNKRRFSADYWIIRGAKGVGVHFPTFIHITLYFVLLFIYNPTYPTSPLIYSFLEELIYKK